MNVDAVADLLARSYAPLGIPFTTRILAAHPSDTTSCPTSPA